MTLWLNQYVKDKCTKKKGWKLVLKNFKCKNWKCRASQNSIGTSKELKSMKQERSPTQCDNSMSLHQCLFRDSYFIKY